MSESAKTAYGDGATRSSGCPPYSIIPPEALRALAERFGVGIPTHGFMNCKRGMPVAVAVDHIHEHLRAFALGELDDKTGESVIGNMGAVMFGAAMIIWAHHHRPELVEEYQSAHAWDGRGDPPTNPYK